MTNVLFIFVKARMRSPAAADILMRWRGFNTDFADLSRDTVEVTPPEHIDWADIIFVMARKHKARLPTKNSPIAAGQNLISRDIPDNFNAHDSALMEFNEAGERHPFSLMCQVVKS